MSRFNGKTVLVTGGNSGIGLGAARAFAKEGARVVITGRDQATLDKALALLPDNALAVRSDAATPAAARALTQHLQEKQLSLDAVFINAGITRLAPFAEVTEAMWDETFSINSKGAYFTIQALLPLLNRGASIVLNGSINAHIGMPNSSVYAASKAALISLAKTLSAELLPRGVRVNVVSPGPIDTPLYTKFGLSPKALEETSAQILGQVPVGRFGTADELASTILHLAATESAFIVGTEIIVDGGMAQL